MPLHRTKLVEMLEEQLWYAGPISERKAEEILTRLGSPGCFLVRDSLLPEADYVLSVISSDGQMTHFPIIIGEGNTCTVNNYTFDDIQTAIMFYCENRLAGIFLNLPVKSVIGNANRSQIHNQPVVRSVQMPKPITCSTATKIQQSPLKQKVAFEDQDCDDSSSSEDEGTPLIRYQSRNGSIYTLPIKPPRKNLSKTQQTSQTDGNTFNEKKALFEQLTQPDIISSNIQTNSEEQLRINHFKSNIPLPPPPPPPLPPPKSNHPPPTPPKPSPKKFVPNEPIRKNSANNNFAYNPMMYEHEGSKTIWTPTGPTIAVPTAILAGMKFKPFGFMDKENSFEENIYSVPCSNEEEEEVPQLAIPTAILAGLTPPIPPVRVESARCGNLRKHSFIYDSVDSILEIEGDTRVIYNANKTERIGSPVSIESAPEVVVANLGRFARIKNFFRWK